MDDPSLPVPEAERALEELDRLHRWVGNGALWRQLVPRLRDGPGRQRLLDVGTGNGRVAAEARRRASALGVDLVVVGLDRKLSHLAIGRRQGVSQMRVVGDGLELPFRDGAVDVTVSSHFQHHFTHRPGSRVLAEMRRVAERAAIVVDIRRSRLGSLLGRVVLLLLRMGPVTAYDGRLSLDQAWTMTEVRRAVPTDALVELRRCWPFRWALELRSKTLRPHR
jgi:ubiquinone/menaquinone biosynthesis C-methylase UbiE